MPAHEFAAELVVEADAGIVQTRDLDGPAPLGVRGPGGVQGGDGGGVPDAGGGQADDDLAGVGGVVEPADEAVGGGEEQLSGDPVDHGRAVGAGHGGDLREAGHPLGEDDHGGDRADDAADGEVAGGDHDRDGDLPGGHALEGLRRDGVPVPDGEERERLLERVRGFEEAARRRVAELRAQLARAEESAATLHERPEGATTPAR
ncbi:hypothetical protein GCM10010266_34760 [Streptomyces griseomycini]|nr:hypothetical protein GCM10010266_34760 [Streptomyces griseomycini]